MRWDSIAQVHEFAFIRRLSVWLLILPLLVRAGETNAAAHWQLGFKLPFTWGLLYCAAVLFLISTALYTMRCPRIIRDYKGWHDYRDREGSYERLIALLTEVIRSLDKDRRYDFLKRQFDFGHIKPIDKAGGEIPKARWRELSDDTGALEGALVRSASLRESVADAYAATREEAQTIRTASRRLISGLHIAAGVCALALLIENSLAVYMHYFPDSTFSSSWSIWR